MDIPIPTLDFRLLDIDLELSALDYHLNLIEQQIRNKAAFERILSQKKIKKLGLTSNDLEWHEEQHELDYIVEFLLSRLFRGPFLISLYAVYESGVTEVAALIQKRNKIAISINDLKGDFLKRAKKYYNVFFKDFELCSDNGVWQRISMLSDLRNAIAHVNGRIEMLNDKTRKKITGYEKQKVGISSIDGYIIVEERFLKDTLSLVSASLNDLVERYKEWDDKHTSS